MARLGPGERGTHLGPQADRGFHRRQSSDMKATCACQLTNRAVQIPAGSSNVASFGDAHPASHALFLHQLTDTWDDLAAVQLNVGHEGFVG